MSHYRHATCMQTLLGMAVPVSMHVCNTLGMLPSAPARDEGMRLDELLFSFAHPEAPQGRVDPWVILFISGEGDTGGQRLTTSWNGLSRCWLSLVDLPAAF